MGCAASKNPASASPVVGSVAPSREIDGANSILANSLRARAREDTERSESGGSGKVISSKSNSSRSYHLENLTKYIEGEGEKEQEADPGWPAWLTAVSKEAVQGWAPLKAESYQVMEKIGQGTYSNVFKARDLDTGKIVAVKKVQFDHFDPESVRFMTREIIILRRLNHPNILKLEGLIASMLSTNIYLVFEYMEHDLAGLSSSPDIKFTESQIKCYMHQLLSGLEHCHSRGIMHRDIKCANLLLNNDGILKLADFGLANFSNPEHKQPLTSRVVTLWYRPPELLLGSTNYEPTVDLWSVGCVFAEMFSKKPILHGRTEVEQIHKIFKLCGSPPEDYWKKSRLPHAMLFKPQQRYENCLKETLRCLPQDAFTLLVTLLSVEPYKRGTASTALSSEYFKTKPYASEPSSLPKYPPTKEIDTKCREDQYRKRIAVRGRGPNETRYPPREYPTRQPNGSTKVASFVEESQQKSQGAHKLSANADSREAVELKLMPAVKHVDKGQQLKHSQGLLLQSGPVQASASSGFALSKRQKEDRSSISSITQFTSRGRASGILEPLNILQATNNHDFKGQANTDGEQETRADSRGQKPHAFAKRLTLKKRGKSELPAGLFDASNLYHSHDLSEKLYNRDAVHLKHVSMDFQDKGDKAELLGPLLSQSHNVDELLETRQHQIRKEVRRSWFQRGRKLSAGFSSDQN